jgi:hypothetical protein
MENTDRYNASYIKMDRLLHNLNNRSRSMSVKEREVEFTILLAIMFAL